jgi:hypothetical protein
MSRVRTWLSTLVQAAIVPLSLALALLLPHGRRW